MADEKNTVVCYYCKQPIANPKIPAGFKLPVCESDECRRKYYESLRQAYSMLASIGGRVLY